jgi:hypothetical protein
LVGLLGGVEAVGFGGVPPVPPGVFFAGLTGFSVLVLDFVGFSGLAGLAGAVGFFAMIFPL